MTQSQIWSWHTKRVVKGDFWLHPNGWVIKSLFWVFVKFFALMVLLGLQHLKIISWSGKNVVIVRMASRHNSSHSARSYTQWWEEYLFGRIGYPATTGVWQCTMTQVPVGTTCMEIAPGLHGNCLDVCKLIPIHAYWMVKHEHFDMLLAPCAPVCEGVS